MLQNIPQADENASDYRAEGTDKRTNEKRKGMRTGSLCLVSKYLLVKKVNIKIQGKEKMDRYIKVTRRWLRALR